MNVIGMWHRFRHPPPRVAVIRLEGPIGAVTPDALTLDSVEQALERAFFLPRAKAVAILVNSPGGAAVQSKLIHDRIRTLSEETGLPVFVFIEDMGASGGYMIALAGDEIYADAMSLIGPIGVIAGGFGFVGLLEKLGVERRVYSAGTNKAALDPFLPENPEGADKLRAVIGSTHESFKALVRERRGTALKAGDDILFNADFWTGEQARALGLVDDLGGLYPTIRARYGKKTRFRRIPARKPGILHALGFSLGAGAATTLLDRIAAGQFRAMTRGL